MFSKMMVMTVGLLPRSFVKQVGLWQAKSPLLQRMVGAGRRWSQQEDLPIRNGQGAGLLFRTGESNFGYILGTSEPQTQDCLAKYLKTGDVLFDIGSNVGFLTVIGGKLVGKTGAVYAFDPVPKHAALVRHNAQINDFRHVQVFEVAVADKPGQAQFMVAAASATSRLNNFWPDSEPAEKLVVKVVQIDEMVANGTLRPPTVVKIDVEGAELDVLKGMVSTLAQHKPVIVCDTHGTHREVAEFLEANGYWAGTMEDINKPLKDAEYFSHALAVHQSRR